MDDPDPWDALDDEADSLEEARGQSMFRHLAPVFRPMIDAGML